MDATHDTFDRRDFLRTGFGAAAFASALAGVNGVASAAAPKKISLTGGIPTRPFGKTGYTFPVLGHGGSAMMEREYRYYGLSDVPSFEDRVKMVRNAYDKGVRYFDTARIYQESEKIMGEGLKGVREDVFVASKVLVRSPEGVRPSVEQSLRDLQMDYIDLMQIHGPVIESGKYEGAMKLYEQLVPLREQGLIRHIGLTGHNAFDQMYKMIATGNFDSVLIEYGYFRKGYNTRHSEIQIEWRENCVAKAHELGMGIVAMKVLGAWIFNHNAKNVVADYDPEAVKRLPAAAIRWVLNDPRISVLNIGVSYPGDIEENIKIITADTTLTNEDRLLLADFSTRAYLDSRVQEMPVV